MEKFILVRANDRVVKVTAKNEGTINKMTLRSAFQLEDDVPIGLFKNDLALSCRVDDIFELQEGWIEAEFELRWEELRRSRPITSIEQAQFRIPSRPGTPMSPYHPELPHDPAPSAKCFIKWMFFLNEKTKSTTICVHPRFFVTFRHGSHRRFDIGDNLKLYHAQKEVDEQTGIEVRVAKIFEAYDFILLKSKSDVVDHKPTIAPVEESEPFTLAGFGNDTGCLSYLPGSIHSVRRHYFSGLGPFILGTSQSSCGDSSGGVWGSRGLIGMNYGCTMMPWKNHQEAISEAAIFNPKNIISPAVEFEKAYMEELEKERKEAKSPPNKKSCLVTVIDGCTLYGAFV
ncbi:unnamed protein product [Caenorhabditis sp. 36 PRJEB53466]|nr:unnamed protein product [Caenorhabditis sp. 36 PRJEB53466]